MNECINRFLFLECMTQSYVVSSPSSHTFDNLFTLDSISTNRFGNGLLISQQDTRCFTNFFFSVKTKDKKKCGWKNFAIKLKSVVALAFMNVIDAKRLEIATSLSIYVNVFECLSMLARAWAHTNCDRNRFWFILSLTQHTATEIADGFFLPFSSDL